MSSVKVLIVGGGTGGHISPGIALYESFSAKQIDAYLMVGIHDKKFPYLHEVPADNLIMYKAPNFTRNIFKLPFFAIRFYFAYRKVRRMLKKLSINRVVGMGGYVSAPALMAAKRTGVPLYLCEQNTVPGKVTLTFAKHAVHIFTTFDSSKDFFKEQVRTKCIHAGNPIRKKSAFRCIKTRSRRFF